MRKICHLTSAHPYNDNRIFHKECVSLSTAGFEVCLIAPVDQGFVEKGITVLPAGRWKSRYARLLTTIPRILFLALKFRAEIFHFHDPELLMIAPILRLSGAKVIYDVHEDYTTSILQKSYIPKSLRNPLARIAGKLETLAARCCHQVIAEKYYKERFPDATAILNYPLLAPSEFWEESVDCSEFSSSYDWLLYSGNVTVDRGALAHLGLLEACDSTAIAYVGRCASTLAAEITSRAAERGIDSRRIKFIGSDTFVPPGKIAGYTHQCHWLAGIALFPKTQHYEKKELTKFFEYMSAGLPVIASNFPAWKDVIEANHCGVCLDPHDLDHMAGAIALLKSETGPARTMGAKGREAVTLKYNWPQEAHKLVQLYGALLHQET